MLSICKCRTVTRPMLLACALTTIGMRRAAGGEAQHQGDALEATSEVLDAVECSIVRIRPTLRAVRLVVLLELSVVIPDLETLSPFVRTAYWQRSRRSLVGREHFWPSAVGKCYAPQVQHRGAHRYGLLVSPGRAWCAPQPCLGFPVMGASTKTVRVRVVYAVPTNEMIGQFAVIDGQDARKASGYEDAIDALEAGKRVRLYLNAHAPEALRRQSQEFEISISIKRRPTSFEDISKRENRAPSWHFDGAWVFGQQGGPTTLVWNDRREQWTSVEPGFFVGVAPQARYGAVLLICGRTAFQRSFREARRRVSSWSGSSPTIPMR